jgi:hypothetical protein
MHRVDFILQGVLMSTPLTVFRPTRLAISAVAMATLLAACGGGGGGSASSSTSNTATSTSTTTGTVTGFGSVYVDGRELEDALASTRVENADGSYTTVALQLGQRVSVSADASGTASVITVGAAVIGAVSNIDTSAGEFKAAGQWVAVNSDSTTGPVTVYAGGYTALTDLIASDLVEVHGSAVYSTTHAAYVIHATRIEKKSSISAVRITGTVSNLDTTAKTFSINGVTVGYSAATVVPTSATLANGLVVTVWGPSGSLTGGSSVTLAASRLRVLSSSTSVTSGTGQLGGVVSNYDATAKTLTIDGVSVNLGSSTISPSGASIGNGAYVQIIGTFGSDGTLTASSIKVREASTTDDTAAIHLKGAISSYVDATSFVVRGIPVDASAINLATACPSTTLANGVIVNIVASQQSGTDVVKATSLTCLSSTSTAGTYTMHDLSGTAGTVDSSAKTFVLTLASTSTQAVLWSDLTAWGTGVTSSTLSGLSVVVEGYLNSANVLVARSIRLKGTEDVDQYGSGGDAWDNYNRLFRSGHH